MGLTDNIYAQLPVWAQHAMVSAYGVYWYRLRFGPGYEESLKGYLDRDRYTAGDWQDYQAERLRPLLRLAARSVPFYREHWTPAQKRAAFAGRLGELPLLEKESVRADPWAFVRKDVKCRSHVFHTSGSTGTPIKTVWTSTEFRSALAVREARSMGWAGVSFSQPRATFAGRMVEPDPNSEGPFYRYNVAERQVYLSAFHLRADTAKAYLEALRRHQTVWLTGYGMSFYLLAKIVLDEGLEVPPIKAIVTTSEKVTPEMRDVIERGLRCRVYEEYSSVENTLFASECEAGRLHVSPDAGVVEILRPDGTPCAPGEEGEVVTTGLMRDYQPMIRFRLGDIAAWDDRTCTCGRQMPVLKEVCGRMEDVVVGPDGRQMVRFHGVFVGQAHIREGQVIQEALNRIRIKVVPTAGYGAADTADVIHRVTQRLGPDVEVVVETVDAIPRTKSGKFKAVVSHLQGEVPRPPRPQPERPRLMTRFGFPSLRHTHS